MLAGQYNRHASCRKYAFNIQTSAKHLIWSADRHGIVSRQRWYGQQKHTSSVWVSPLEVSFFREPEGVACLARLLSDTSGDTCSTCTSHTHICIHKLTLASQCVMPKYSSACIVTCHRMLTKQLTLGGGSPEMQQEGAVGPSAEGGSELWAGPACCHATQPR